MSESACDRLRILNRIRARLDASFLSERVLAMPSVIYIGLSSICDLRCPYCPRQYYTGEISSGLMSWENFLKVAEYLAYAEEAYFFGIGEPLLHPRFFDFLEKGRETGVRMTTSTHGMTLDETVRRRILDVGLHELSVSMDGADRKTFDFLRQGASFDAVCTNLTALFEMKKREKKDLPKVCIATAVSRHNVKQLADIVAMAYRLGAARVVFTDLILVNPEDAELSVSRTDVFQNEMERARLAGTRLGVEILYFYQNPFPWKTDPVPEPAGQSKRLVCGDAWRMCILDKDGAMQACCYYPPKTGMVFEEPLPAIVNNEANQNLRRMLLEGHPPECCLNCGMLKTADAAQSLAAINDAKRLFENAEKEMILSEEDRETVREEIARYKDLYDKTFGSLTGTEPCFQGERVRCAPQS